MKSHYVDMPLQIPIYFSFICHYIGNKTLSFGLQAFCFSQFSLKLLIICRDNLIAGQLCTILANSKSREKKIHSESQNLFYKNIEAEIGEILRIC